MSIEKDKKPIESANRLTGSVAIRIEQKRNMKEYTFGRHWNHESIFVSALNRESIDLLKEHFRDEVPKEVRPPPIHMPPSPYRAMPSESGRAIAVLSGCGRYRRYRCWTGKIFIKCTYTNAYVRVHGHAYTRIHGSHHTYTHVVPPPSLSRSLSLSLTPVAH